MRLLSLRTRNALALGLTCLASLFVATSGAQAVVVDMNSVGSSSVAYNSSDQSGYYGLALVPGTSLANTIPAVTSSPPCLDPALSPDLTWQSSTGVSPLCSHGGAVMHANETYALTWDPDRRYWHTTLHFVENFLSDVAATSGSFASPYSITPQYTDGSGRAANSSLFAGGCVDFGNPGGYSCDYGMATPSTVGSNYPANGCTVSGNNVWAGGPNGPGQTVPNDICLTDAQIRAELATSLPKMGVPTGHKVGYAPLVDVLLPAGVEVCVDSAGGVCSAYSTAPTRFCSYHSHINVNGTDIAYVVQPWTASWGQGGTCDDPGVPVIPNPVPVDQLPTLVAARLVSPLSQGELASIINPALNTWFGLSGSEINDNGCGPLGAPGSTLDNVTLLGNTYQLQREFNNAGAIETDPQALPCIDWTSLTPTFVVPSTVNAGDVVQFDGSTTVSSLIVPKGSFLWSFGDGTTATGPSVTHAYAKGGTYAVKLTVTDRGGNVAGLSQTITVLGPTGQPVPVPSTPPPPTGGSTPPGKPGATPLKVHLQLLPQGLKSVLRSGIAVRVTANQKANGIVTVSIPRSAARHAHIKARAASVVIGRGTVSSIKNGLVVLHLHLSRATANKLRHLRHVTLSLRMVLIAASGQHLAIDAAGRY